MKKAAQYSILILFDLILLIIITNLALKIRNLVDDRVKGTQYVNVIRKEDIVINQTNTKLEYFYEPKSNNIELRNPDWLGYKAVNTINSDSLNERYDYSINKIKGVFRIVTMGDSFTFGVHVDTKDNYSEVLEELLNNKLRCEGVDHFDVINLGVSGYDVEYTVERFKKRGIKYNPDLVIWLLNTWNIKLNEYKLKVEEELSKQGIENDKNKVTRVKSAMANDIVKKKYGEDFILNYQKNIFENFEQIYKGKILMITFASSPQKTKENIFQFIKSKSNFLYSENIFDTREHREYSLPDGHPNKEGHKKIAESIYNYLLDHFLINCQQKN